MKSPRKSLINKVKRDKYNKTFECREDKHLWIKPNSYNNVKACKCCGKIVFK